MFYSFRAGGTRSWIGLYRPDDDDPWRWTNGFSVDLMLTIDDVSGKTCVTIEKKTAESHQWKGAECHEYFPSICQLGE